MADPLIFVNTYEVSPHRVFHLQLVADHIRKAAAYLDFSSMRIQVFETPTPALVEELRRLAGSGASVTVSPAVVGFNRFDLGAETQAPWPSP